MTSRARPTGGTASTHKLTQTDGGRSSRKAEGIVGMNNITRGPQRIQVFFFLRRSLMLIGW